MLRFKLPNGNIYKLYKPLFFIVGGDLDVAMTMVVGFEEDMVTGQGMKWTNGVL